MVPGHHQSIDRGTDFRGVFRVGSKTMFFEILGGSTCRSIQKRTILGPRQERDGAPKSTPASFGGKLVFAFFGNDVGGQKSSKFGAPGCARAAIGRKAVGDAAGLYSLTLA